MLLRKYDYQIAVIANLSSYYLNFHPTD